MEKDLYDLLNTIPIEEEELEEMPVDQEELLKVQQAVKRNWKKKRNRKRNGLIAAAVCFSFIGIPMAIGIINPAYGAGLPIIGDIFRFLDYGETGIYAHYKENANEIQVTKESQGVSLTIVDALFDGQTLFYTYEIQTEQDFGETIFFTEGSPMEIADYSGGMGGSSEIKQVGIGKYVGQDTYTLDETRKHVDVSLHFDTLEYFDAQKTRQEIKGNWDFSFGLDAVEGTQMPVLKTVENSGITVTVESLTKLPMSCVINFSYRFPSEMDENPINRPSISLLVTDNLGNTYESIGNSSFQAGDEDSQHSNQTINTLAEDADKLILTPIIHVPTNGGGVSIDENGKETTETWTENPYQEQLNQISFAPIEIDLN